MSENQNLPKQPPPDPKKSKRFHDQIVEIWQSKNAEISSDVLGSFTGTPEQGEKPEQDADDL